ncbi:MAG: tetratricopeptide repeat protein [Sandaracinaceae bacterium]|nr:tetratricopeptide repeat protein [Sandaracinaceae bacterium]
MKSLLLAAVLSVVPLLLGVGTAAAQEVDARQTAMARALFEEGVHFADQNEWAQAADRFERALALRGSATIEFNLATAYEHLGRLVEASERLTHIGRDTRADARVQASAAALLAQIRPRMGRLIVQVTGSRQDVSFELDGRPLPGAAIGVAGPVDPGQHVIRALRGRDEIATATVDVSVGAQASASLELPAAPAIDPRTAANAGQTSASDGVVFAAPGVAEDDRGGAPWGWIVVGGVVVVAVVVVALLATSGASRDPISGDSNPAVLQW